MWKRFALNKEFLYKLLPWASTLTSRRVQFTSCESSSSVSNQKETPSPPTAATYIRDKAQLLFLS